MATPIRLEFLGGVHERQEQYAAALEKYEEALAWELEKRGLRVQRQVQVPVVYKGQSLGTPMRLDLLVEGIVIVECKATGDYNEIFESQVLTYLRMSGLRLGLVINFGEKFVKDGIHRVVNGL